MGIAYSPPDRVIHADIDASTSLCLRNGLHKAALLAGWEIDRAITDGYVYLLTSPQKASLQMKVQVHDTGRIVYPDVPVIDLIFMSADEVNKSASFVIEYGGIRRIRAHVGPCQIFTYRAGVVDEPRNAVMGGIPFVDPNALDGEAHCADDDNSLKTTTAWWACGDLSTADYFWPVRTFRDHWVAYSNATQHNSDFLSQAISYGSSDLPVLRLVPANKPGPVQDSLGIINLFVPMMMRWMGTEEPLNFDPLIAWNTAHPVKVRGQLWDAFVRTKYVPPESPLMFEDLPWFAYSSNEPQFSYGALHWYQTTDLSTVYLREPGITMMDCSEAPPEPSPELSNYVY